MVSVEVCQEMVTDESSILEIVMFEGLIFGPALVKNINRIRQGSLLPVQKISELVAHVQSYGFMKQIRARVEFAQGG